MKPKTKILALIYGLVLPYIAMVTYFALRIHDHRLPAWFPYFGLSYILATMIVVMIASRAVRRGSVEREKETSSVWRWVGRSWAAYLVTVWSGLLVCGAYLTLAGRLDWRRSVPGGAFLLAFIAFFSWALYKDFKGQVKSTTSAGGKSTSKTS